MKGITKSIQKNCTRAKNKFFASFFLFAAPAMASNAEKMLEKPTAKIEDLAQAFGNIAPVASLIAIVLVGIAMQANYLPKKWAINIIGGSVVVLIAGLIADFLYG